MQGTFALSYLVQLAIARILGFIRHWYVDGSRFLLARYHLTSRSLEDAVASRAMLHLLFRPLYGDYSVVGRIIGPIFRMGRLLGGLVAHGFIVVIFAIGWIVWVAIPPFLIIYAAGLLPR